MCCNATCVFIVLLRFANDINGRGRRRNDNDWDDTDGSLRASGKFKEVAKLRQELVQGQDGNLPTANKVVQDRR